MVLLQAAAAKKLEEKLASLDRERTSGGARKTPR